MQYRITSNPINKYVPPVVNPLRRMRKLEMERLGFRTMKAYRKFMIKEKRNNG